MAPLWVFGGHGCSHCWAAHAGHPIGASSPPCTTNLAPADEAQSSFETLSIVFAIVASRISPPSPPQKSLLILPQQRKEFSPVSLAERLKSPADLTRTLTSSAASLGFPEQSLGEDEKPLESSGLSIRGAGLVYPSEDRGEGSTESVSELPWDLLHWEAVRDRAVPSSPAVYRCPSINIDNRKTREACWKRRINVGQETDSLRSMVGWWTTNRTFVLSSTFIITILIGNRIYCNSFNIVNPVDILHQELLSNWLLPSPPSVCSSSLINVRPDLLLCKSRGRPGGSLGSSLRCHPG